MRTKPVGYLASPYQSGDRLSNAAFQCRVMNQMLDDGIVLPFVPLLNHFADAPHRTEQDWLTYDNEMIEAIRPKWILRLNSPVATYSKGADAEVELVKMLDPYAIVVVQQDDETWLEALERLYQCVEELSE